MIPNPPHNRQRWETWKTKGEDNSRRRPNSNHSSIKPFIVLLTIFALHYYSSSTSTMVAASSAECPDGCLCRQREVMCRFNGTSNLRRIPLDLPTSLKDLSITHCPITEIMNGDLEPYLWLKRLILDHNQIQKIGENAFQKLPHLDLLSIRHNKKLKKLEKFSFGGMGNKNLKMYLSDNGIEEIHRHAFYNSRGFRVLDLRGNPIRTVQSRAFTGLYMADFIDFPRGIETVEPDAFKNLTRVHILNLPGLNVTNGGGLASHTFRGLNRLDKLIISHANLPLIQSQAFNGLETVKELHIRNSNITRIKRKAFQGMRNVGGLHIYNNRIRRVDKRLFQHLPADSTVFRDNQFHCSCHNLWITNEQNSSPKKQTFIRHLIQNNYCASPVGLRDRVLAEIPESYHENCRQIVGDHQKQPDVKKGVGDDAGGGQDPKSFISYDYFDEDDSYLQEQSGAGAVSLMSPMSHRFLLLSVFSMVVVHFQFIIQRSSVFLLSIYR